MIRECVARIPALAFCFGSLAAIRRIITSVNAHNPFNFFYRINLSQWKFGKLWKSEENRARLFNAAKKAGIPEFPKDQ